MELWLLLARLILALVFGAAGIAKLAGQGSARQTLVNFGLPESLARPLALLLPIIEVVIALALIPVSLAWWGALGALVLLGLFISGISVNLARGKTPDCNCFGQLHAEPIGWRTIARNSFLALVAAFIIVWGSERAGADIVDIVDIGGWTSDLTVAERVNLAVSAAALVLLAVLAVLAGRMLKQQAHLLERIEELEEKLAGEYAATVREDAILPRQQLPIGAPAPDFSASDLQGETVTLDSLLEAKKSLLLFFVAPNCAPCAALLPEFERWQEQYADRLTLALVSKGAAEENQKKFAGHAIRHILLQNGSEVSEAYHATWTPGALLIRADGTVGSHIAFGSEEIQKLVHHASHSDDRYRPWTSAVGVPSATTAADAREDASENARLKPGDEIPSMPLHDLSDQRVDLIDALGGRKTLLLFWSPGCGYCQQMLDDVKVLESQSANQILLISAGTVADNLQMELKSRILLDKDFATGRRFGSTGTPSAVLIDENGQMASSVGVGKIEVLALAGFQVQVKSKK